MNEVAAASSKGTVFEDVLEVLWAPGQVFDRSRAKGVGMYILVLTAITLVIVLATNGLLQPYIDANFDVQMQQMAARGKPMPAEAAAAAQKFAGYGFIATGVLMIPIGAVLTGLLVWIGGKVVSAPFTFGQGMLIATLASVPRVLSFIATAVQGAIADPQAIRSFSDAALGAARFVDPVSTSPALMAMLANFDVFNLWQLVIIAVGISVIGRVERSAGVVGAGQLQAHAAPLQHDERSGHGASCDVGNAWSIHGADVHLSDQRFALAEVVRSGRILGIGHGGPRGSWVDQPPQRQQCGDHQGQKPAQRTAVHNGAALIARMAQWR